MAYHFFIHLVIPANLYSGTESPGFWVVFYVRYPAFATYSQLERPQVLSPFEGSRLSAYRFALSRQRDRLESAPDSLAGSLAGSDFYSGRERVTIHVVAQTDH